MRPRQQSKDGILCPPKFIEPEIHDYHDSGMFSSGNSGNSLAIPTYINYA